VNGAASERILVVKLGALGDIILAMGPMAAIRRHHARAHIVLLTSAGFAALGEACPYVDEVWIDRRPSPLKSPLGVWRLRARLRASHFARVYDLQTSDRSSFYFQLMRPSRPEWSGIARGASHPHDNPRRDFMHTVERQREQLARAGIDETPLPDLSWLTGDISGLGLDGRRLALLVPGGAAHRPDKRWPAAHYGAIAADFVGRDWQVAILGGPTEAQIAQEIRQAAPAALDLTGRTDYGMLAALGRRATYAIGNDTGPIHILSAAGCPITVLYSAASDPELTQPVGPSVTVLRRERLADLSPAEVAATLMLE
jgi:ADP-heptose:LPS heptosyltransferase